MVSGTFWRLNSPNFNAASKALGTVFNGMPKAVSLRLELKSQDGK
jgi:hypothetical protein